jgi:hypothetical protein
MHYDILIQKTVSLSGSPSFLMLEFMFIAPYHSDYITMLA